MKFLVIKIRKLLPLVSIKLILKRYIKIRNIIAKFTKIYIKLLVIIIAKR